MRSKTVACLEIPDKAEIQQIMVDPKQSIVTVLLKCKFL